jgi:hypothetical protein
MTLEDYAQFIAGKPCALCRTPLPQQVGHHDSFKGYPVQGFEKLQRLYVQCPKCRKVWPLWEFGVEMESANK